MIELINNGGYTLSGIDEFPVYLPDYALASYNEHNIFIKAEFFQGSFRETADRVPFHNGRDARHVPELPLNRVIGIPSLEGKIFEED